MLTTRINPRKSAHVHRTLGIILPDINESYGLEIRRGVVQFHQSLPENPDLTITLNKSFLNSIMVGESAGKLGPIPYTPLQGLFAGIDSGNVAKRKLC